MQGHPKLGLGQGVLPEVAEELAHIGSFQWELDPVMAENNVTETQLEKSNEPKFPEGLEKSEKHRTRPQRPPAEYRAAEQEKLEDAKMLANERRQGAFKDMNTTRKAGLTGVNAKQAATEKTDDRNGQRPNFITNIKPHLITGLVESLTGSLG